MAMIPLFRPQTISTTTLRIYRLETSVTHEILASAAEWHLRAAVLPNTEDVDRGAVNSTKRTAKG